MKANELRIGNLTNEGEITLSDFYNMCLDDNCPYTPIPLTEDIFLKAGWRKGINGYLFSIINSNDLTIYYSTISNEIHLDINGEDFYPAALKYLHQLQNLYFALTGEELCLLKM